MSRARVEEVGQRVRAFYEECSFPGYEEFDSPFELVEKSRRGVYARALDEQLPLGVRVLDAGCGTGQLAIFLSMTNRRVVGIDFSYASLRKGQSFKKKFGMNDVSFARMDLFRPGLREESFDYVFCNGVLHHTVDAYGGFQVLCRLVKKGGYIVIGLYNTYGRLLLDLRRLVFRFSKEKFLRLDYFMRQRSVGEEKKRIWFLDQYENPHEEKFSVKDVLSWFGGNNIEYVSSIQRISMAQRASAAQGLFEKRDPGTGFENLLFQLGWIFTTGREGGFFITIGRKQ
jgi:SAM-dependent methyltransferase